MDSVVTEVTGLVVLQTLIQEPLFSIFLIILLVDQVITLNTTLWSVRFTLQ